VIKTGTGSTKRITDDEVKEAVAEALEEEPGLTKLITLDDIPLVTTKAARYKGNPVLSRGGAGAWDEGRVDNPVVLYDPDDQLFKMWYSGRDADHHNGRIGYATSADGISWTKYTDNPVFNDNDTEGYPNHNTEVASVMLDYIDGKKIYLMVYEQQLYNASWQRKKFIPKVAKSTDGISWTIIGKITDVAEDEIWDGGSLWRDREGKYHYVAKLVIGSGAWWQGLYYHFTSEDFVTWTKDATTIDFGNEIFGPTHLRVDDLRIVPMGRFLLAWANYFTGGNGSKFHQPLEVLAGYSWDRLQRIGNAIYPEKEIREGINEYAYHEPFFVVAPTDYGHCARIYYFEQYNPAEGTVTFDINMAYVMLGRKRTYPVVEEASLAHGATTDFGNCTEIPLEGVNYLALTVEADVPSGATADPIIKVHLRGSPNGVDYDTEDLGSFYVALAAGATVRKNELLNPHVNFMKVLVENLDGSEALSDVKVYATLGR